MANNFSELRNKMSPESRERAEAKAKTMLESAGMTVNAPRKRRYKLNDLLAEMPGELPHVEGGDATRSVSKKVR